jgi:hypothetical protein
MPPCAICVPAIKSKRLIEMLMACYSNQLHPSEKGPNSEPRNSRPLVRAN